MILVAAVGTEIGTRQAFEIAENFILQMLKTLKHSGSTEGTAVLAAEESLKTNSKVAVEVDAERLFCLLLDRLMALLQRAGSRQPLRSLALGLWVYEPSRCSRGRPLLLWLAPFRANHIE